MGNVQWISKDWFCPLARSYRYWPGYRLEALLLRRTHQQAAAAVVLPAAAPLLPKRDRTRGPIPMARVRRSVAQSRRKREGPGRQSHRVARVALHRSPKLERVREAPVKVRVRLRVYRGPIRGQIPTLRYRAEMLQIAIPGLAVNGGPLRVVQGPRFPDKVKLNQIHSALLVQR